jgi:mannose-6-phosphate isomerase-like protein (cupin superfamily)
MKLLSGGCRVFEPDDGEAGSAGNWKWRKVICRASGADRITQSVSEIGPGRTATAINPGAEEVLYIAAGEGVCYINGFPYDLRAGTGVYVPPGAEYSIENGGEHTIRLLHACCPEDPNRRFVADPRPPAGTAQQAPKRTVHEQDRDVIRAGKDREFRYLVHTDVGCRQITQFAGWIPPSKAPVHHHTYEEGIFILEGHGIVHVEGESCEFGPGASIYFPIGARHCVENPGPTSIRLLGAFYPSGSPGAAYED